MTILDQLAAHARQRVAADQEKHSLHELKARCKEAGRAGGERFFQAMKRPGISFICEVKKASPSKGIIAPSFPYLDIARDYAAAGADAVSCLTEPMWFLGSDQIFTEIRQTISLPMIRKDFTVSEYQIYQARLMGADCVLLICALLDTATIAKYLRLCDELGLSALVEAHDAREIRSAIAAGAKMIGVNNRNLKDFSVDFTNAARLRDLIPPEAVYVAESGVARPADVAALKFIGADAVLGGGPHACQRQGGHAGRPAGGIEMTKIKLCGLSRPEDIAAANEVNPDYIGFVFAPKSKRYVSPTQAAQLKQQLAPGIQAVGVFVKEDPETVVHLLEDGVIDVAQLHGGESEAYIRTLRQHTHKPIIQAFRVDTPADLEKAQASSADYILLDSGDGGTGETFDWSLLAGATRPYFLAGGLDPENVGGAVEKLKPYAVDVSSGIETDGTKDPEKMRSFVRAVRGAVGEERDT